MRNPLKPEVIGPESCPILHRWTLIGGTNKASKIPFKLMVHHFLPHADERDVHDHPRGFTSLVLRGSYDDMAPCARCEHSDGPEGCSECGGTGVALNERMKPGMLRYRPPEHRHRTKVGPHGCWTIVLMGPLKREWGFWHKGKWFLWRDYEARFGVGMRCGDEDE